MDARELRYFAEVVDQGSIGRAAESLGISQPALTKCIRQLELRLKVKLLERSTKGVSATVYGQSLYARAKSITAELARARAEIEELSKTSAGVLTVGVLPSQAMDLLPEAAVRLATAQPGLRLRVLERPQTDLMAALLRGEFDLILSVVSPDRLRPNISYKILFYDRPAAVVRRDHPLALPDRSHAALPELAQFPWVLPPPGSGRRMQFEQLLASHGLPMPPRIVECHSISFLKSIVAQSDYVGLLPNDAAGPEERAGLVTVFRMEELPRRRAIGVLYRNDYPLTEAALALIRELQRASQRLAQGTDRPARRRGADATAAAIR